MTSCGRFPLDGDGIHRLQKDLIASFAELSQAAERALKTMGKRYWERLEGRGELEGTGREGHLDTLKALFERHLPRLAEHYGERPEKTLTSPRTYEAFAADTAAVLMARIIFLRLLEDLGLAKGSLAGGESERRREFVELLVRHPKTLIERVLPGLAEAYREPFEEEIFAWVLETNGEMDEALQRLILRVNAYDFSGLSEEVLGDIYQNFLPPDKRKRLGEFYTPKEVVDLILRETALTHPGDYPRVLDPACGSGSFLVRYLHHRVEDAKNRGVHMDPGRLAESIWGFDLNPFAAYISLFQLLWGLLRLKRDSKPRVHVYNLNALLDDRDIASYA